MEEYRDVTNLSLQDHTTTPLFDVNYHNVQRHSEGQHMFENSENNDSMDFSISGYDEPKKEKTNILVNENTLSYSENEKTPRDIINDWWFWEVLSSIVALCVLIAIIVILWMFEGKSPSKWPYSITMNTLISFLSTVFKAAMLIAVEEGISQMKWLWFRRPRPLVDLDRFDSASRGPYGSLKLLWTLHGLHIPTIGALVMLAAILVDPFTQQVIQLRTRNVMIQGINATIPRANFYNISGMLSTTGAGSDDPNTTVDFPTTIKASIYTGIFNSDAPKVAVTGCSSGNCSFPSTAISSYSSIGVCSKCNDITNLIHKTCNASRWYQNETQCTSKLPNGMKIPSSEMNYPPVILSSTSTALYENFTTLGDATSTFSNFTVLSYVANDVCPNGLVYDSEECSYYANQGLDAIAAECSLYACVKSYSAEVRSSTLIENVTNVDTLTTSSVGIYDNYLDPHAVSDSYWSLFENITSAHGWFMVPETCIIDGQAYSASSYRTTQNSSSDSKYVALTYKNDPVWVWADCVYAIGQESYFGLTLYFSTAFDGYVEEMAGGSSSNNDYIGGFSADQKVTIESINSTFQNLASALTDNMRTKGYGDSAIGSVWEMETYVHIEWGWLALPIALMLLSLVFLVLTIVKSRRSKIWKSSVLPLMYYGFTDRPKRAETLKRLNTRAEKEKIMMFY